MAEVHLNEVFSKKRFIEGIHYRQCQLSFGFINFLKAWVNSQWISIIYFLQDIVKIFTMLLEKYIKMIKGELTWESGLP